MRSYGQFCAVAKALDVVGDRWTLLIVRELILREGCRYTDLRAGLPGIATNLLADRLRELEEHGIVEREEALPPVAATLFKLTSRGKELAPVLHALGQWGASLMAKANRDDEFRSHWLALPVSLHLRDTRPQDPPVRIEVRTGDRPMVIEASGSVRVSPGPAGDPDAVVSGPPMLVLGYLTGRLDRATAVARGLRIDGATSALRRIGC
jgi:DNA-binding HxlR family transcriptional regulator